MKTLISTLLLLSLSLPAFAANTWYVRTDGGDPTQCDGLHDAASTGSGKACALNDINWVLGFQDGTGYRDPNSLRFKGGDTLIIDDVKHADGSRASYTEGVDMPGIVYGVCSATNDPYDCTWGSIPAGPDSAHPSRVLGKQWDSGCKQKPLLLQEGVYAQIDVGISSNIEINCLDLEGADSRDKSAAPNRAQYGIYADPVDPLTNLTFKNLDIHGFRNTGILLGIGNHQGLVGDVTMDRVRVYGNAGAGIGTNNPGNGTITITNSAVEWTGCYEHNPQVNADIDDPANYYWCFSQGQVGTAPYATDQGYGDAIAFGPNGNVMSGNWSLDHVSVRWNTQDGFDTIHGLAGAFIDVTNSWFEGNAGATVKLAAATSKIENNLFVSNCGFFDSQTFTNPGTDGTSSRFLSCRAGTAVGFPSPAVADIQFYNNTVVSNQDVGLGYGSNGTTCTSSTHYRVKNNLFIGGTDWVSDVLATGNFDLTDIWYEEGCDQATFEEDYNVGFNVKHPEKLAGAHDKYMDPKITGTFPLGPATGPNMDPTAYYRGTSGGAQLYLAAGSPAIGAGTPMPDITTDINGYPRPATPSVGAYEYGSVPTDGGTLPDGGTSTNDGGTATGHDGGGDDGSTSGAKQSGCGCTVGGAPGRLGAGSWLLLLASGLCLVWRARSRSGRPRAGDRRTA